MVDVKAVVCTFKQLSSDVDNQPYIARERGCVSGLVGFLAHNDPEVALAAAETVLNLSSHPDNNQLLAEEPELIARLKRLLAAHPNDNVRKCCYSILRNLQIDIEVPNMVQTPNDAGSAASSSSRKFVTVDLQVDGLIYEEDRERIEKALIQIPGVISVTCDLRNERASVRSTVLAQELMSALDQSGINTSLIQETFDFGSRRSGDAGAKSGKHDADDIGRRLEKSSIEDEDEGGGEPDYLPTNVYGSAARTAARASVPHNAIATRNLTSLEQRLEEQRRREVKKKHKQESLVGKFKKAFFW